MISKNTYINQKYCVYNITYFGDKLPSKNNSNITPSNYIGSTEINKIKSGYMGSVKSKIYKNIWKSELKDNINLFSIEIISYHDTRPAATYKELQIQKIFNVVTNPLFVNMSYAQPNGYYGTGISGEYHPNYNNKWNDTQKALQSNKLKEYFSIEENKISHQQRCKTRKKYKWTALQRLNRSKKVTGKNNPNYNNRWKKTEKQIKDNADSLRKYYKLINPKGEIFITKNIKEFSIQNKLSVCNLYMVASGSRNHHKGWKCEKY